jgi:hypothetical protein
MKQPVSTLCLVLVAFGLGTLTQGKEEPATLAKAQALGKVTGLDSYSALVVDEEIYFVRANTNRYVLGGVAEAIKAEAKPAELSKQLVKAYAKHLDEKDLDALLAFYATPAGKVVAAKLPFVLASIRFQSNLWMNATRGRALTRAVNMDPEASLRKGKERSAILNLKVLAHAQALFRELDKDHNNTLDYAPNLLALGNANLIDPALAGGTKDGYRFQVCRGTDGWNAQVKWMAIASPVKPGPNASQHFAINLEQGISYRTDKPFVLDQKTCEPKGGKRLGK